MINLKDNTRNPLPTEKSNVKLLKEYSHYSLGKLLENNSDLFLYSDEVDGLQKLPLWHIRDNHIQTNNLMGFIGLKDERNYCTVRISSRFTNTTKNGDNKESKKDYFLHYMLQKVFLGQVINLNIGTTENENFWEFYHYLFPYYLNKALAKGLYKEYVHKKYNDMNLSGSIDIKRHIKQNVFFQGNIAYNTREHSYNNRITQLIRHTIEYISSSSFKSILNVSMEIRENISQIEYSTPNFHHSSKQNIIQECYEKISNPYWEDYEILRKLCLKILRHDKLSFEGSDDKVHGILFDGSWLWEEYLATLLVKEGFIHPDNRNKSGAIKLAKNGLSRFPDFYCETKNIVIDAKYKRHPKDRSTQLEERREDTHQMLTYMYRLKSEKGIFVYPSEETIAPISYHLLGHSGELQHQVFKIPKMDNSYQQFCNDMKVSERSFTDCINFSKS